MTNDAAQLEDSVHVRISWSDGHYDFQITKELVGPGVVKVPKSTVAMWHATRSLYVALQAQLWRYEEDAQRQATAQEQEAEEITSTGTILIQESFDDAAQHLLARLKSSK